MYVYIPRVKFCITPGMFCRIELSTSFTVSLRDPFTLNKLSAAIGVVNSGSVNVDETVVNPAETPTFNTAPNEIGEIC